MDKSQVYVAWEFYSNNISDKAKDLYNNIM